MSSQTEGFTIGVEEEYLVLDPVTRGFRADGLKVQAKAKRTLGEQVQPELQLSQVEKVFQDGNGAMRQRRVYERTGKMEEVIDSIVAETAQGIHE